MLSHITTTKKRTHPLIIGLLLAITISGCHERIALEGFDPDQWKSGTKDCSTYRLGAVDVILENRDILLSKNQNEIELLLGKPEEHELYSRNQKFFHYRLTPADSCGTYEDLAYLSIRFNAIGRANEIQKMLREL